MSSVGSGITCSASAGSPASAPARWMTSIERSAQRFAEINLRRIDAVHLRAALQRIVQRTQDHLGVRAEFVEQWTHESVGLFDQSGQHVLAVNLLMVQFLRHLLRRLQGLLSLDRKFFKAYHGLESP